MKVQTEAENLDQFARCIITRGHADIAEGIRLMVIGRASPKAISSALTHAICDAYKNKPDRFALGVRKALAGAVMGAFRAACEDAFSNIEETAAAILGDVARDTSCGGKCPYHGGVQDGIKTLVKSCDPEAK